MQFYFTARAWLFRNRNFPRVPVGVPAFLLRRGYFLVAWTVRDSSVLFPVPLIGMKIVRKHISGKQHIYLVHIFQNIYHVQKCVREPGKFTRAT